MEKNSVKISKVSLIASITIGGIALVLISSLLTGYIVNKSNKKLMSTMTVPTVQQSKGIKGDVGAQGLQGETGNTGGQGLQGIKGEKGDTGAQGLQGEKGEKSDTGTQGLQGEKGEKGDTGAQGLQGEKGQKGDTGAQGLQGEPGMGYTVFDDNRATSYVTGSVILYNDLAYIVKQTPVAGSINTPDKDTTCYFALNNIDDSLDMLQDQVVALQSQQDQMAGAVNDARAASDAAYQEAMRANDRIDSIN